MTEYISATSKKACSIQIFESKRTSNHAVLLEIRIKMN